MPIPDNWANFQWGNPSINGVIVWWKLQRQFDGVRIETATKKRFIYDSHGILTNLV
jgi:hypothetical protein